VTLASFYHHQKILRVTFLNKIEKWIEREEKKNSSSSSSDSNSDSN